MRCPDPNTPTLEQRGEFKLPQPHDVCGTRAMKVKAMVKIWVWYQICRLLTMRLSPLLCETEAAIVPSSLRCSQC